MNIEPLGDSAWILRNLPCDSASAALALDDARLPGLIEAFASYDTVGIVVDPLVFDASTVTGELFAGTNAAPAARTHAIPVCYDLGEDLDEVCRRLDLSKTDFVSLHTSTIYRCYALGFCPGFAYLGYLADVLSGIPRREQPRPRVTPGSVAITGRQTAVYPLERPGGWSLVGRTPLVLVDVATGYFPIGAGDEVRFESISGEDFERLQGKRL